VSESRLAQLEWLEWLSSFGSTSTPRARLQPLRRRVLPRQMVSSNLWPTSACRPFTAYRLRASQVISTCRLRVSPVIPSCHLRYFLHSRPTLQHSHGLEMNRILTIHSKILETSQHNLRTTPTSQPRIFHLLRPPSSHRQIRSNPPQIISRSRQRINSLRSYPTTQTGYQRSEEEWSKSTTTTTIWIPDRNVWRSTASLTSSMIASLTRKLALAHAGIRAAR